MPQQVNFGKEAFEIQRYLPEDWHVVLCLKIKKFPLVIFLNVKNAFVF